MLLLFVMVPIALLFRINLRRFIQAVREPAIIAFSTSTSEAALPRAMEAMERFGVPRRIVSFVMPLGYTFNLDGTTLYLSLAAVFVAQAAGVELTVGQQVTMLLTLMLTSKGVAGVPRASLVILAGTLASYNLPLAGVTLILGVDALMDMARTMTNVIGNCLATAVVARWEGQLSEGPVAGRGKAGAGDELSAGVAGSVTSYQLPVQRALNCSDNHCPFELTTDNWKLTSFMTDWGLSDALDDLSPEELRQRLHSLQAIIARAPVPIAIAHDPDCRFISANRALAALLRLPETSNISLTPSSGEPPYRIQQNGQDIPAAELPMQYAIGHRTSVSNEIEIVRADGTVVYVQNDVEPLYDTHGRIYGCVSVCVDHTFRKLAEIGLRDADRRKDEFLATLSHELRSPLAPIRTAIEVMRLAGGDRQVMEAARITMERQVLHLVRITDDLLDVARITQNKMELKRARLDVRAVLTSAMEATRATPDARDRVLTIDLPGQPVWVDGDVTRLVQAFSNLLANAVKFTERGGRVRISAAADGSVARIAVEDSGVGIPPDMLARIFDMFTQLQEYRDRTQGGLGIGLTLARRLIELHGGTIEAFSEGLGRGSRFVVQLPLAAAPHQDAALPAPRDARGSTRRRVLVAEDNVDAAEMMRVMLGLNGHDVRVAPDGAAAVAVAHTFRPHIAFVDIGMPRMDGYEVADRIRRMDGPRTVLVALTGWGQDEDKRRSRDAGFDHHLTKPPEPEVVQRLIAACVDPPDRDRSRDPMTLRQSSRASVVLLVCLLLLPVDLSAQEDPARLKPGPTPRPLPQPRAPVAEPSTSRRSCPIISGRSRFEFPRA